MSGATPGRRGRTARSGSPAPQSISYSIVAPNAVAKPTLPSQPGPGPSAMLKFSGRTTSVPGPSGMAEWIGCGLSVRPERMATGIRFARPMKSATNGVWG